ncbi:MAG: hypothetical protein K1X64_00695 [Myxococcaceae bacterium]|nr:hypothetical protein [Myxococcaceae bacterium]
MGPLTVQVRSPSARRETWRFFLWCAAVLAACAVAIASRVRASAPGQNSPERLPYQQHFSVLDGAEQRRFLELREGILEIENIRGREGRWPSVEFLRAQALPPVVSGLPDAPPLKWQLREYGDYVNYTAFPESGAGQQWLILFIEPPKGLLKTPHEPPAPLDEEHHTLSDGTALHVTVWRKDASSGEPQVVVPTPAMENFTQLLGR